MVRISHHVLFGRLIWVAILRRMRRMAAWRMLWVSRDIARSHCC
jgi:hypothetical protein